MTVRRGRRPAPQRLSRVISDVVTRERWEQRLQDARILQRWPEIAGEEIAAHTRALELSDGVMVVAVGDPIWATQLSYLIADLLARFTAEVGPGLVRHIRLVSRPIHP